MRRERRCGNCARFCGDGAPCESEDWVKQDVPRWEHGGECCDEHEWRHED